MEDRFGHLAEASDADCRAALGHCVQRLRAQLPRFTWSFPGPASIDGIYPQIGNVEWTTGFWTGQLWLAYEYTGDEVFKSTALIQVEDFLKRIQNHIDVDHHDMGFLYSLSCVAACKLTGDLKARTAALLAADNLVARYHPKGRFLQAWGAMGAKENYRLIIDCLLNVPLLYWAARETGDGYYRQIADAHTETTLVLVVRPDYSTYHTFFFDPDTGKPAHGATCQGFRDDSAWTRGQAWGIYGTALGYREKRDPRYADIFRHISDFYLCHLGSDMIPYWDLGFTEGNEPRDSSSAAITACAFLEMSRYLAEKEASVYRSLARRMLKALIDGYMADDRTPGDGLLLHGTYSKKTPFNTCTQSGVDERVIWGDYFFMEALTRLTSDWLSYW